MFLVLQVHSGNANGTDCLRRSELTTKSIKYFSLMKFFQNMIKTSTPDNARYMSPLIVTKCEETCMCMGSMETIALS